MAEMGLVRDGHIFEDSAEVDALRDEVRELKRALGHAESETAKAKQQASRATANLRRQLSPLYRALQDVFGELEELGGGDETTAAPSARTQQVWQVWKDKLGKGAAKAIDALLIHGSMTRKQLMVATGYSQANISNIVSDLNGASLITKDGDRVSLRQL